jgi:hypothetical protein
MESYHALLEGFSEDLATGTLGFAVWKGVRVWEEIGELS